MPNSNLEHLIAIAEILQPLLPELVFVGGAITGLLVNDETAAASRATFDVDVIVEITSYAEYAAFGERLRRLGFSEDIRTGAPVCRWIKQDLILDVMPTDPKILGFSNRWYQAALDTATWQRLSRTLKIRMVTAPLFIATKFEAFKGRGQSDLAASQDLEDIVFLFDGRDKLLDEVRVQSPELQAYLREEIKQLLMSPDFVDALPRFLLPDAISQSRLTSVLDRMRQLAVVSQKV